MAVKKILILFLITNITACSFGHKKNIDKTLGHTGQGILVIEAVVFDKDTVVNSVVRQECQLTKKLTVLIDKNASAQYAQILTNTNLATVPAETHILNIVINGVNTGDDELWGGDSGITLKGVLKQKGVVLGDFSAGRASAKGMFDGFKNPCSILIHSIKALSKDVAGWLENPVSGAILGNYQSGIQ